MSLITEFLNSFWSMWLAFAPYLLLGSLVAGILHVFLPHQWIQTHLSRKGGVWKSVLFGVPLPLCSCGVIPAGLGLRKDGASQGSTLGFMISTPQTGVDSIWVSGQLLGWPFAFGKVGAAIVTGLIGGTIADRISEDQDSTLQSGTSLSDSSSSKQSLFNEMIEHMISILYPIWKWILFGIVASSVIDLSFPAHSLETLNTSPLILILLGTLLLSLPLYVCATSSVPIAAVLVAKGLPLSAALVFLMAGPATNIATMGAIYKGLGKRILGVYLCTLIGGSIGFAFLFEFYQLSSPLHLGHAHSHSSSWFLIGCALLCSFLFFFFIYQDVIRWFKSRSVLSEKSDEHHLIHVEGMTCGGCVRKLERTLEESDLVTGAQVQRNPDQVLVFGTGSHQEICELIQTAGFKALPTPK